VPAGNASRCTVLAALAMLAAPAHAEFQEDYALGLSAIDAGRYADARKYLERALAAQSEPVDKVILNGSIEQPYLPYHFLGIVAYKLGECDAAKANWNNATNRRMTGRLNQIRQQEQRLADSCQTKVAEAPKEETPPPAAPEPAPAPVVVAPPVVEKPAKGSPAKPAKPVETERPAVADKEKPGEPPAQPERVPPPRLVRAVDSYLAGRYNETVRIDPEAFPAARTRFHAYLIRAAARYTQAQISGDKELLAAARSDAAAAYKIEPQSAPDAAMFSPKFRAFYAQSH